MLSRMADNLFWLSRYMERAENLARILDVAAAPLRAALRLCRRVQRMGVGHRDRRLR